MGAGNGRTTHWGKRIWRYLNLRRVWGVSSTKDAGEQLAAVSDETLGRLLGVDVFKDLPFGACRFVGWNFGDRTPCGRKQVEGEKHCYWHLRNTEKYRPAFVATHFGPGVSLSQALEAEVKSGGTLTGFFLEEAPLHGDWFEKGANLSGAKLLGAQMRNMRLSYGSLRNARVVFSDCEGMYFSDVDLADCTLSGSRLYNAKFRDNRFDSVEGLEMKSFQQTRVEGWFRRHQMLEDYPDQAEPMYRALVGHFSSKGALEDASWAAYRAKLMRHRILKQGLSLQRNVIRAMVADGYVGRTSTPEQLVKRGISDWARNAFEFGRSFVFLVLFGYGEKPLRVAVWMAFVIMAYGGAYWIAQALTPSTGLGSAIYFSVVTFTTLGYGDLLPKPEFRWLAASEALAGILLTGLFLFTLARRATGRA